MEGGRSDTRSRQKKKFTRDKEETNDIP